jgi:hypothetical protein
LKVEREKGKGKREKLNAGTLKPGTATVAGTSVLNPGNYKLKLQTEN